MEEFVKKHLEDVLNACNEVEAFLNERQKTFQTFAQDVMWQRAVERNVEIMGEALNRIKKDYPDFQIENAKAIISTRNRVIHGYDSVTPEFLWGLVVKHIPLLKKDIETIFANETICL